MFGPLFKRRASELSGPDPAAGLVGPPKVQTSHVLPRLAKRLSTWSHPRVLDLGSVIGGNLQFFIELGCKISADDLLKPVEVADHRSSGPGKLEHANETFDAVIAWDAFDFLARTEAKAFAGELLRIMKPGGMVFAYFTTRETERRDPGRRYRILGTDKIEWLPVGNGRSLRHIYQNRDILQMLDGFKAHTAFVLQNGTREMLLEKKFPNAAPVMPGITPLIK
jgi:hypothetical protein